MSPEVEAGIAWLDATCSEWRPYVSPEYLDMGSTEWCILGQVFNMNYGRILLDRDIPMSDRKAIANGFDIDTTGLNVADACQAYNALTEAWRRSL